MEFGLNALHSTAQTVRPKVLSAQQQTQIKQNPATVSVEGDLYSTRRVKFKSLSKQELQKEQIQIDGATLTTHTTNAKRNDDRVLVAFRDPADSENIITLKLEKDAFAKLQKSFSEGDFFKRDDEILRLTGAVEEYVASWYNDIAHTRGYVQADSNGNGKIDEDEVRELKVGYNKRYTYDYLENKIDAIGANVTQTYVRYGDTMEFRNKEAGLNGGFLNGQSLNFEKSIEEELSRTLTMDKNSDGIVTLHEGLDDKKLAKNTTLESYLLQKTQQDHDAWLARVDIPPPKNLLQTRDISLPQIKSKEELEQELEKFKAPLQNAATHFKSLLNSRLF
jgi:hypothetical protein